MVRGSTARFHGVPAAAAMREARRQRQADPVVPGNAVSSFFMSVIDYEVDPDIGALRVVIQNMVAARNLAETRRGRRSLFDRHQQPVGLNATRKRAVEPGR